MWLLVPILKTIGCVTASFAALTAIGAIWVYIHIGDLVSPEDARDGGIYRQQKERRRALVIRVGMYFCTAIAVGCALSVLTKWLSA